MEECLISKKKLPSDRVVYTLDGPVAIFLWGRNEIKTDGELALIPVSLFEKYKKALGRDPDPAVLEPEAQKLLGKL